MEDLISYKILNVISMNERSKGDFNSKGIIIFRIPIYIPFFGYYK